MCELLAKGVCSLLELAVVVVGEEALVADNTARLELAAVVAADLTCTDPQNDIQGNEREWHSHAHGKQ